MTMKCGADKIGPIVAPVDIEGSMVDMEVDTGSCATMAPMTFYTEKLSHLPLQETNKVFVSFTGENTRANGKVEVNVRYGTYSGKLTCTS